VSSEPRNLVERAADAGMDAIREHLAHADANVDTLLVLLTIKGAPTGEPDTVSAGHNVEDAKELIALLGSHFIEAARQVGMRVDLVPIQTKGQG